MDIKEQIKVLINNYKNELEDIDRERSQWDGDYTKGCYSGKEGTLCWVITDLEKLLEE